MTSGHATEVGATAAGMDIRIVAHAFPLRHLGPDRGDPRVRSNPTFPMPGTRADDLLHLFHVGRDGIVHVGAYSLASAHLSLLRARWGTR